MSSGNQAFTQQQFKDVGDTDANFVGSALLDDLTATTGFIPSRAVLDDRQTGFGQNTYLGEPLF